MTSTRRLGTVVSLLLAGPCLAACWSEGNSELGLLALLHIQGPANSNNAGGVSSAGAQFVPGAMPKPTIAITVPEIDATSSIIYPGEIDRAITGRVGTGAQVVAIGLQGDVGYWILPLTLPDQQYVGNEDFSATGVFSSAVPFGNQTINYQAGDGNGHFGPPAQEVVLSENLYYPQGYLIVHVEWDSESDLDLHVVTPDGAELWAKDQTTFTLPPPGSPTPSAAEVKEAGILQWDSNGNCVIDGFRAENAYWPVSAATVPTGTYTVRVDAFSMCGQPSAAWKVSVEQRTDPTKAGTILGTASGELYPRDTMFPHTTGSGTFALSFTIP